jgi:hypothetical protein
MGHQLIANRSVAEAHFISGTDIILYDACEGRNGNEQEEVDHALILGDAREAATKKRGTRSAPIVFHTKFED